MVSSTGDRDEGTPQLSALIGGMTVMTSLVWEESFNTGVEAMDVQRRKIFDYLALINNELVNSRQKCDSINGLLDQLEILCQMHFMDEERLMIELNYPFAAEHKHLHDLFLATVDRFKIESNRCHTPGILDDFGKLRVDFTTHILNESMLLSDFIKSNHCDKESSAAHF
jgi:hemerythrin-like metal-binding protein